MSKVRVKICCVASVDEARMAIAHGASAIGLVSAMPSGPGVISEKTIAEIAAAIPPPTDTFLLTSLYEPGLIVEQQRRCGTNTIQVCDRLEPGADAELRRALPGVTRVQVIHVTGEESLGEAVEVAPQVDALLLDSGSRAGAVVELGGTGRTHDWEISRRIREAVEIPLYLAGGLRAENVAGAIRAVAPFAVDVCSGVRTDGKLDEKGSLRYSGVWISRDRGEPMQPTMEWFQRKFQFDLPVWMFPNIVERLRGGPARVEERVKDISPRVLIRRDGDRWSIQENVGHLLVVESLCVRRLEDFLADKNELTAADLKNTRSHESNFNEIPLENVLREFRQTRLGFVERLDGLDEAFVARTALHPRLQQPMRVIDSAFFAAEHDDHHLSRITELMGMFH